MRAKESLVVKFLIENSFRELNILSISKALKMDYKTAYSIIKRLENISVVRLESFGHSRRVKLNLVVHPLLFEAEFERRKEILRDKNLAVMLRNFKRGIKSKSYVLLLFGSYAKKTYNKNSDIDLMFICPTGLENNLEKDVNKVASSMPLPIHHYVFSESQFLDMINAKEPNVGQEALQNNIILCGIEQYYEMM